MGLKTSAGAEVNILADGTYSVRMLQLSLHHEQLQIDSRKQYPAELSTINNLCISVPMAICLTGKGVLIRKMQKMEAITEQSLGVVFPNMQLSDFYIQHVISGEYSFLTLVRKETADRMLEAFHKQGAQVVALSLGPFVVNQVIPQLNNYQDKLYFDGHHVVLDAQKQWLDYSYDATWSNGFELKVDIEPIAGHFLLAYAAAFQLMLHGRLDRIVVESANLDWRLTELMAKLKFRWNGLVFLFSLFVLLLLNFVIHGYYHSQNQDLSARMGQRSDDFANKQKLESALKEKEELVRELGWNKGLKYAFLCDQIGQTLPSTIMLYEFSLNAMQRNTGMPVRDGLEIGSIRISGRSNTVYAVNDWVHLLKKKNWLRSVALEKYIADDQQQEPVFTLRLNY